MHALIYLHVFRLQVTLTQARSTGLKNLYSSLGFGTAGHKNSFDYLRSLGDVDNAHLSINFDTLIVGPTKP